LQTIITPIISPNPSSNTLNLSFYLISPNFVTIEIIDIFGVSQMIFNNLFAAEGLFTKDIDINLLAIGTYFLRINVNDDMMVVPFSKR